MRFVLGIEDSNDISTRYLQGEIHAVLFVNGLIIEDDQLDVWIAQLINFCLCFGNGSRIIFATNSQNLHQLFGIVEPINFLQSFTKDFFFMPGRQENRKGETGFQVDGWSMIEPGMFGNFPDKEAQAYIEDGLNGHHQDDKYIDRFQR